MQADSQAILDRLLPYQVNHVKNLSKILITYNRALDASDTGTGKTSTFGCLCKLINYKPLIIIQNQLLAVGLMC